MRPAVSRIAEEDEDDPYAYDEKDITSAANGDPEDDGYEDDDVEVDLDVLPTLLAYRDGELVHTWVRVDWEAGKSGVSELLSRYVSDIQRFELVYSTHLG